MSYDKYWSSATVLLTISCFCPPLLALLQSPVLSEVLEA